MMDTRRFEIFVTVAEELSFTNAASRLKMAQSSASERVRALEQELGTTLFERRGKEIALTRNGVKALADARLILRATQRLKALASPSEPPHSRIRIGVKLHPHRVNFAQMAREFNQAHPNVELLTDASDRDPRFLIDGLRKGRHDMVITVLPDPVEEVEVHTICQSHYAAILPEESPLADLPEVSLSDLRGERWVDIQSGHGTRTLLDRALQKHRISRTSMMEISDFGEIPRLVAALVGHAVIPEILIDPAPGAVVVPLLEPIDWTLSVAMRPDAPRLIRELVAIIVRQATQWKVPEIVAGT